MSLGMLLHAMRGSGSKGGKAPTWQFSLGSFCRRRSYPSNTCEAVTMKQPELKRMMQHVAPLTSPPREGGGAMMRGIAQGCAPRMSF